MGLIMIVGLGIALLLFLILAVRLNAFLSLLVSTIFVGLMAGMTPGSIMETVINGMGSTLGFVAIVIGLGAMFGAILEASGAAQSLATWLIEKYGIKKAPYTLGITGFLVAIPVFFEVAFILLVPLIYALQKRTGSSLLLFAIPLLAGLAVTHAFIPPTPGPIAVADILGADLGWVILIGAVVGLPTAIVCGPIFGTYLAKRIYVKLPLDLPNTKVKTSIREVSVSTIIVIIGLPIVLILLNTFTKSGLLLISNAHVVHVMALIGHPIFALILANFVAWYLLGIRSGFSKDELQIIHQKSFGPAGTIILITGAGGVFKQMLVDTGAGNMIAESLSNLGIPIIVFAYIIAAIIRISQGSATVAMITAAGLVAPLIENSGTSPSVLACNVIAIAAGASILSHVNDSGFWLVKQYLGMTEKQTFKSWTMMTILLSIIGFVLVCALSQII